MLAVGDCAHAQLVAITLTSGTYMVTLAILASFIVVGLIGNDSIPLGSERSPVSTPWQRTDKDISFSELALNVAPAASDRMWPW